MSENKEKEEEKPVVAKTAIDLQRLKLQKLMKNPVNMSKYLKINLSCLFSLIMILTNIKNMDVRNILLFRM